MDWMFAMVKSNVKRCQWRWEFDSRSMSTNRVSSWLQPLKRRAIVLYNLSLSVRPRMALLLWYAAGKKRKILYTCLSISPSGCRTQFLHENRRGIWTKQPRVLSIYEWRRLELGGFLSSLCDPGELDEENSESRWEWDTLWETFWGLCAIKCEGR